MSININNMDKIENFITPKELEKLNEFFEKIYYNNELVQYGDCFNYQEGRINIFDIIDLINEYHFEILLINNKRW